ncbi:DnaJ family domain-containing protein [Pontibacillus salipaludis]|uniref:DUF1992 domain-containing protein n=1 Tax=Pontibacillus salipaludis TaxID=1697394 RepID=A0ABQ1QHF5_9BACI|nr:DUF1992 domain-containing protein [Pontibacillus salipaludis]
MDYVTMMAEEKIKQAEREGAFKDLPGKGKPLDLSEIQAVPEDLRASFTILKNANMLPEEMEVKKEMIRIEELVALCTDEEERLAYQKELNEKQIHFQTLMEKRKMKESGAYKRYSGKIRSRFGL